MRSAHDQPWVTYTCPFCQSVITVSDSVIDPHRLGAKDDCEGSYRLVVLRILPKNVPVTVEAELHPSRKYKRGHFGSVSTRLVLSTHEYPEAGGSSVRALRGGLPTLGRNR